MQSKARTVEAYLKELPEDRRAAINAVRAVFRRNLDKGIKEGMQYGAISYFVPHSAYPPGYHCDPSKPLPFAGLGSQKHYMSLGMMHLYMDPAALAEFRKAWAATGRKIDMGKCCIRFKKLEDLPLDVIGAALRKVRMKSYIERYESLLPKSAKRASAKKVEKRTTAKPKAR